ncbi:MAG: hypothetical protein KJ601_07990 [Nanoarchaeota archaeon]|nr:hypothetical protein [Nanoarchaeota archaeon]MBU1703970.1 hypothetical protein [Nanoarchaeota archaeon]
MSNLFLAVLIAFLGIVAGLIIALMTKEELKPGKKYFLLMRKTLLLAMVVLMVIFLYDRWIYLLITATAFIIVIVAKQFKLSNSAYNLLTYLLFGLVLFYASLETELFVIESVLVFIYGLTIFSV